MNEGVGGVCSKAHWHSQIAACATILGPEYASIVAAVSRYGRGSEANARKTTGADGAVALFTALLHSPNSSSFTQLFFIHPTLLQTPVWLNWIEIISKTGIHLNRHFLNSIASPVGILTHQGDISKVYLYLSDSLTDITSRAPCDAKNESPPYYYLQVEVCLSVIWRTGFVPSWFVAKGDSEQLPPSCPLVLTRWRERRRALPVSVLGKTLNKKQVWQSGGQNFLPKESITSNWT